MLPLRPFFSYFGSKWNSVRRLCPKPNYKTIIEPFAGSASYSLHYHWHNVSLSDKDPLIAALWRYLIGVSPGEIMELPDIESGKTVDDYNIAEEAKWLIGFWCVHGTAEPAKKPSGWMNYKKNRPGYWGPKIRTRIAQQISCIRHWKIKNEQYTNLNIEQRATWFVDPPYIEAGKRYKMGAKNIDFSSLGHWCQQLRGQVMVCENLGAQWLPFKYLAATRSGRKRYSVEAIWYGGHQEG